MVFIGRVPAPVPPDQALVAHNERLAASIDAAVATIDGALRELRTRRRRALSPHEQQFVDALLDARHALCGKPEPVEEAAA